MPRTRNVRPATVSTQGFTEEFQARRQDALFYLLLALVLAVAEMLALYLILSVVYRTSPLESFLGQVPDSTVPWSAAVLLSRGTLQPLNCCLFGFGATLLVLRMWMMPGEFKAFDQPYFAGIPTNERNEPVINEQTRAIPLANVRRIAEDYSGTLPLLVRRLEAGSRRLAEEGDATQVQSVMQAVADIDRDALESRFTILRYLIWLIPTIGFLGTVMGIGRAIAGFTGFLARFGGSEGDFQSQLQPVLGGMAGELGVAFDTTVLALLLSALIVAMTSIVQSREEGLLSSIDEFCLRYFVSKIAVPDFGSKQMTEMIQQALMSIAQVMMGQTESGGGVSLQDLAGKLDHVEHVVSEGAASLHPSALASIQSSVRSLAESAEKISRALEDRRF